MDTDAARARLEEMRSQLDKSITLLQREHPAEQSAWAPLQDPADAESNMSAAGQTEAILTVAVFRRLAVAEALQRIEDGAYGKCADCGSSIPDARLEARPQAARCMKCQTALDRGS